MMGLRLRIRSVTAWTRASARSGEWDGAEVGGPGTHLVFEGWEAADVVDSPLLVEGGDGFGPDLLAMSGADGLDGQGALYRVPHGLDMFPPAFARRRLLNLSMGDSQSHVVGGEPSGLVRRWASTTIWVALNLSKRWATPEPAMHCWASSSSSVISA